jgi:hypothetical protein
MVMDILLAFNLATIVKETCFQPLNKAELIGELSASSGTAESEGRQMKQC